MKAWVYSSLVLALSSIAVAQQPMVDRVLNAASLATSGEPAIAPGSLVSIFGNNLAASSISASTDPLPLTLGGVSVTIDGTPAPILFVSTTHLNVQAPWALLEKDQQSRTSPLQVTRDERASTPVSVQIARYSPALFTLGQNGSGPVVAVNSDGSFAQSAGSLQGRRARPAQRGSVISIYANGLGGVSPSVPTGQSSLDLFRRITTAVEVLIGGRPADVLFSGLASSVAGANHLNIVVPLDVQPGNSIPVQLRVAGTTTPPVATIAVDSAEAAPLPRPGPSGTEIWSYLVQQNFRQNFKLWPGKGQLYDGIDPHGMLLTTYVNQLAYDAINRKTGEMPPGALIVKENHMPDRTLAATTLMYKVPGYDAANNDWFWMTRTADGTIANEGKVSGCYTCHSLAAGNDYLFIGSVMAPPTPNGAAVREFLAKQNYRQAWRRWPGTEEFYKGSEPHSVLLTTYVNQIAYDAINRKAGRLPAGSIVVKENYMPDKTLAALTVMYKAPGFDPANNDWYWHRQMPDGAVPAEGRIADCINCHKQATDNDFLFVGSIAPLPDPKAAAVWDHLEKQRYQSNWKLMPGTQAFSTGSQPHGSLVTTYVNQTALDAVSAKKAVLPAGSIVVKENYMPDRTLTAVTVMYKSEGYDPDHSDWYWLQRQADGTVGAEGRVRDCFTCHSAVARNDYLFTAPSR